MIDEKKLIEYLETLVEFERKKSQESAQIGVFDMATCYGHGEYCYKNAINAAEEQPKIGGWIPCSERLPEEKINPVTNDFYEYQVTFKSDKVTDVRHYKFGRGHWWNCGQNMDKYVTAWREPLEEYHG